MKLSKVIESENKRVRTLKEPVQTPVSPNDIKKELEEIKQLLKTLLEKLEK